MKKLLQKHCHYWRLSEKLWLHLLITLICIFVRENKERKIISKQYFERKTNWLQKAGEISHYFYCKD
jgi:hypothetical protein